MNRVLFHSHEISADNTVSLDDNRARHLLKVLKIQPGQIIKAGIINGMKGDGEILAVSGKTVTLRFTETEVSQIPKINLLMAVPRPKVMRRLWPQLSALGLRKIVLCNAAKVERPYFDTHWLEPDYFNALLINGLEQAGETQVPEVQIVKRFRPFVEDEMDTWAGDSLRLLAHPGPKSNISKFQNAVTLAIGPEGGWTDFEIDLLTAQQFQPWSIGSRVLRSDTAVIGLLAILNYLM